MDKKIGFWKWLAKGLERIPHNSIHILSKVLRTPDFEMLIGGFGFAFFPIVVILPMIMLNFPIVAFVLAIAFDGVLFLISLHGIYRMTLEDC